MGKLRALSPTKKPVLVPRIDKAFEEEQEEDQHVGSHKPKQKEQQDTQAHQQQQREQLEEDQDSDSSSLASSSSSESLTIMPSFQAFTPEEMKHVLADFDREAATQRRSLQTHQRDLLASLERRLAGECEAIPPHLHHLTLSEFASYEFNLGKASRTEFAKHMLEDLKQSQPSPKRFVCFFIL